MTDAICPECNRRMTLLGTSDGSSRDDAEHRATLIRLREDRADVEQRLRDAILAAAGAGMPETQIAEAAGIARMTVRSWLGK